MNNDARKIFVKNLDRVMRLRHVTQADIVRALGLTASSVSDWCLGKSYPRVERMQELADFLGVPMVELTSDVVDFFTKDASFAGVLSDPDVLKSLPPDLDPDERRLLRSWRAATDQARQFALQLLESNPQEQVERNA